VKDSFRREFTEIFANWHFAGNGFYIPLVAGSSTLQKRNETIIFSTAPAGEFSWNRHTVEYKNRLYAGSGLGYNHIFSNMFFIGSELRILQQEGKNPGMYEEFSYNNYNTNQTESLEFLYMKNKLRENSEKSQNSGNKNIRATIRIYAGLSF